MANTTPIPRRGSAHFYENDRQLRGLNKVFFSVYLLSMHFSILCASRSPSDDELYLVNESSEVLLRKGLIDPSLPPLSPDLLQRPSHSKPNNSSNSHKGDKANDSHSNPLSHSGGFFQSVFANVFKPRSPTPKPKGTLTHVTLFAPLSL